MKIENILTPERTFCKIEASSRKRALEEISIQLAETIIDLSAEQLFSRLIAREKMGSTALGHGIAIPHCRMTACTDIIGGLVSLSNPVDFGAFDDVNVEVMFVLIVPEDEIDQHLKVLAMLAKRFEDESYRTALFSAQDSNTLYAAAISDPEPEVKLAQQ